MDSAKVEITLGELADRIRVHVPCDVIGDPATVLRGVSHPRSLQGTANLVPTFDDRALASLTSVSPGRVAAALVAADVSLPTDLPALRAQRPRVALGVALAVFERRWQPAPGVDPTARIGADAYIAPSARVGAYAIVGPGCTLADGVVLHPHVVLGAHVRVGADSVLHSGVQVGDRCSLGARVVLHPRVVVGADGFSYDTAEPSVLDAARESGPLPPVRPWLKIPSGGAVVIEDDVEIGAGSCVDRATLGVTRVGRGTKIDNLVQVGHNITIGEHCLLAAQVGIGGSSTVGEGAVLAGQVGVGDHTHVGDQAVAMGQAGVISDLDGGSVVFGTPALPRREWFRRIAGAGRVDDLRRRVRDLEARLAALESDQDRERSTGK